MTADGETGRGKATFDDRYDRLDPRALFGDLAALDYEIPQHAHGVFTALLSVLRGATGEPVSVLDVCCSYGVNAALLRCDLTLGDLFRRYTDDAVLAAATSDELIAADRAFYAQHLRPDAPRVRGLDTAANAIAYGRAVGLLDEGVVENLETHDPSEHLARVVADVDLVTTTGGVGYVTERTFDALIGVFPAGAPPWDATFVLRMFPYDRIAAALERRGLVTEQLPGTTFRQRRFASASEQDAAVADVRARSLDTSGKEDDGWYHADLFLSRPVEDVSRRPLRDLLAEGSAAPPGATPA